MSKVNDLPQAPVDDVRRWLEEQSSRFLAAVEVLWEIDFHHESRLADLTIGHIMTHVARVADNCADVLQACRTGTVAHFEETRRWPEHPGGLRPGAVMIDDITIGLHRVNQEIAVLPEVDWAKDVGLERIAWDVLTELVVHMGDLGLPPDGLDPELARGLLQVVVATVAERPEWPTVALHLSTAEPEVTVTGTGFEVRVRGSAEDQLRWIIGRPVRGSVNVEDGQAIPTLPAWSCHREFESV